MGKKFSFAAIMSVATGRYLTNDNLSEVTNLVDFLLGGQGGRDLNFSENIRAAQPLIFLQFPQLHDGQAQFQRGRLALMLETETGKQHPKSLILGWLSGESLRLGMSLEEPIEVITLSSSTLEVFP